VPGAILVDSGILYALFNRRDKWHEPAMTLLSAGSDDLIVPATILGETAYLLEERSQARGVIELAGWLAQPRITVEGLLPQDLRRMTLLISKHPALGFVDSSVAAIAERLLIATIATTDRRHFSDVRPSHVERFTLVP
jgi:predicted nucleic acid-binding protein